MISLQALQRRDHLVAPGQAGTAGIGTEFTLSAEPEDDDAGKDAEDQLRQWR
jgi:hypothetical protein